MPLALVTIVSGGGGAAALRFGAPAIVGQDNYATGFRGFGDGAHALGKADGGWYGTSDGGKSWGRVLDGRRDIEGDVHAAVLSSDGRTMHNLGAVAVVADKLGSYYTFNATSAEYFSVSEDLPLAFAATSRSTPVVFEACRNPLPAATRSGPGYLTAHSALAGVASSGWQVFLTCLHPLHSLRPLRSLHLPPRCPAAK